MRVRRWEWPERGRSQGSYEGEKVGVGKVRSRRWYLHVCDLPPPQAALDAISGLDLFGARGGPSSIICVMYDKLAQCNVSWCECV